MSPTTGSDEPRGDGGALIPVEGTPMAVDLSRDRSATLSWAVLLAGPLAATAHFSLVYFVSEAGCTGDGPGLDLLDPPVPATLTVAATAVAALACLAATAWAYRRWHAGRRDDSPDDNLSSMAFAGFLLSALSLVTVLFVGVPAPFLVC